MSKQLGPYLLGPNDDVNQGIYTGDARVLSEAIPDESVDLILTDPPWGISFKYPNQYKDDPGSYLPLVRWVVEQCERVLIPGGYSFVYQASERLRETWQYFPEGSRLFSGCKNFNQCGRKDVDHSVDFIVFWKKEGVFRGRGMLRDWHVANTANTTKSSRGWGFVRYSPRRPLDTVFEIVSNMCPSNGVVLDFFLGTGTTAEAAKIAGCQHLAFEIDPATAELARQRVRETQPPLFTLQPEQMELPVQFREAR